MLIKNYQKKAIVMGATSGIGRGLAKIFVENGYRVGITGRRVNLLNEIKAENVAGYCLKAIDISETDTLPALLEELVIELGGLDLMVICSGYGDLNYILDFAVEKQTIETNVLGFTATADWAFNYFESKSSGHIVGITSIAGLRGSKLALSYNASKAYQINYLEGLRQRANKFKHSVFITDIRPGFVDTDMAKGDGLFWVATVDKAVLQIFKAIKRQRKVLYVTKRWILFALILKILPKWLYEKL